MVKGTVSKLLFVDSSVNTHGDHTKVILPTHEFSCESNERMALSLVHFTQRRNWYNINPTNNTFYLFVENVYYEVQIVPGVYTTFAELNVAIQTAMNVTVAGIAQVANAASAYQFVRKP